MTHSRHDHTQPLGASVHANHMKHHPMLACYLYSRLQSSCVHLIAYSISPPPPGGPVLPICRALSISSVSSRFDAMPVLEAMQLRRTRKESKTPTWMGSMGSPVVRSRPTARPSACSSWSAATGAMLVCATERGKKEAVLTRVLYIEAGVRGQRLRYH